MSGKPPTPPDVSVTPQPRKPSEWSPRSIPRPAPGRSTADPRTPRLSELAQRAARATLTGGPAAPPAPAATSGPPRPLPGGTCGGGWTAVNAERDRILRAGGPNENAIQRNGAISAAYAQYAQRNPENEWAGIASIVSRQARCAMEHARDSMGPISYDYFYRQLPEMSRNMPTFPPPAPTPGPVALSAMGAYDALAATNKAIFSDIYPVLRFDEEFGTDALDRCAASRPGGPVDATVRRALRQTQSADPDVRSLAGGLLANYEQRRIVQDAVLNSWGTRALFDTNQWLAGRGWGRWLGARRPEVALTAGCNDGTPTLPFSGSFIDPNARVNYYNNQIVPAFRDLGSGRRSGIIGAIAGGR